jgi:isopenicillin N synthase-like dioxygenase
MPSTEILEKRYSMAYFVNINGDTLVEPLCQNDFETPKYPPISARDHLMAKHLASMSETDDGSQSEL